MTPDLAAKLRQATRSLHTEVERSDFMRALLRGQLARASYCLMLRNLHALYEALEDALSANRQLASVAAICMPALYRTQALAQDLDTLYGPLWRSRLEVNPACHDYLCRLLELKRTQPELLVAHAYVRYLGDLSGGQQLKRIVARSLDLPAGAGVGFYDFGDNEQTLTLTRNFRAGLAAIEADARQADQIVAEAQDAFARHGELFRQLALSAPLAPDHAATNP